MTKSTDYKLSGITNINEDCQILRYTPFGSVMEGRSFVGDTSGWYRFGFGGQEKDDEIYGKGKTYSAEFWEYDARVGRRWNVDPKQMIFQSVYSVLGNNPIYFIDPYGDKFRNTHESEKKTQEEKIGNFKNRLDIKTKALNDRKAQPSNNKIKQLLSVKIAELKVKKIENKIVKAEKEYNEIEKKFAVVNDALEEFRETNPELYERLDNKEEIIEISAQFSPIRMTDEMNQTTGYTSEGSLIFIDNWGKGNRTVMSVSLYAIYSTTHYDASKIQKVDRIEKNTADLIHAIGHLVGELGKNDSEENANDFENREYWNRKK